MAPKTKLLLECNSEKALLCFCPWSKTILWERLVFSASPLTSEMKSGRLTFGSFDSLEEKFVNDAFSDKISQTVNFAFSGKISQTGVN